MKPGRSRNSLRGIALATTVFLVAGALPRSALGQAAPARPDVTIELPADSLLMKRGPIVRANHMLSREKIQKLLLAEFPARLHFQVQLWSEGRFWVDRLQRSTEYDVFVRYIPVEKKYEVIQVQNDRPLSLGKYEAVRDAESAVARAFAPPIRASSMREPQYYQVALVVEALSESDLDEVGRWLRGDVEPGMTGEANPASIVSRGVRTLASRLLGGEKSEYEATSARFRTAP